MKQKLVITVIIFVIAISLFGCTNQMTAIENTDQEEQSDMTNDKTAKYHKISQDKAKELMDAGAKVIDVREQDEYDTGHIEGAILSPVGNIDTDIANITSDKDELLLIYCRSGNRSSVAAHILVDMGYTNVQDFGGINTWKYDIVTD